MAAPTVTARQIPTGYKLPDGYQTTIANSLFPAVQFWEKSVQAPGYDGGAPIDTTTQLNTEWRTMAPRSLKTVTESQNKVAFDPDCLDDIRVLINRVVSWTVHMPDGSTVSFFGFLQKFIPDAFVEGTFPEATITVTPTNWDPANNVEAGPVWVEAAGT